MKNQYLLTLFLFLFSTVLCFSQEAETDTTAQETNSLTGGTISSQFDYINRVSNSFQEYKVIKKTNLDQIRSNVLDSLNVFKDQLVVVNQKLTDQQQRMENLEAETEAAQLELKEAQEARDSFSFLGIPIHKNIYNTIMWAIVVGLTVALLFFLFKYAQSHKAIARARKDLEDTVEEFEQHRKNTLDRERKLKRELVDALNGKEH
jgi:anion-transporting  ArsA/GET3 family ATPase